MQELRSRGRDTREAGAFLLGVRDAHGRRRILDFVPYDDIDPTALRGYILFDGSRMDRVWEICAQRGLQVVADVHTHPGHYAQSGTDQANPMIPERGHLALIIPDFARRLYQPGEIGIFEFCGRDGWVDHSREGGRFFRLEANR